MRAALTATALLLGTAGAARAQAYGDITVQNDYRLRGHSISSGRATAALNLSYDHPSGIYLNGSVLGVMEDGSPEMLGVSGNIGYARRLTLDTSMDVGFVRSEYRDRPYNGDSVDYNEFYAGMYYKNISSHVYYSPNYYYGGYRTLYSEVEGAMEAVEKVRLSAHVGFLSYIETPKGRPKPRNEYDWRVATSRQFGPVDLRAAVTGGGPGPDYYGGEPQDRTALVVSASWIF